MIISHKHQTVFIHIPKNAGSSVRQMLVNADPECERMWGYRFLPRHYRFGDSAHMALVDLPPEKRAIVDRYDAFAVVRDPVSRFFSAMTQHFFQHRYRDRRTPAQFLAELDSTRIRYDPAYIHFCPQHFFTHVGDRQVVKTLYNVDDPKLEERVRTFLLEKGFPVGDRRLGKANKTEEKQAEPGRAFDWEHFYQLYKRDYDLFNFEPPMEKTFEVNADEASGWDRPIDFSAFDYVFFLDYGFERPR